MGGSNKVARLAFVWGLIACGVAVPAAKAQEQAAKQTTTAEVVSQVKSSAEIRTTAPWIPQRFKQAQPDRSLEAVDLGDNHTIVVSTLALILAGVIVLLLIL